MTKAGFAALAIYPKNEPLPPGVSHINIRIIQKARQGLAFWWVTA